jgi:hypothetical protein
MSSVAVVTTNAFLHIITVKGKRGGIKMDGMMGGMSHCMMDGMCGGIMAGGMPDPHRIIDMLIRHEEKEVVLYQELASCAPNECLKMHIAHMAEKEAMQVGMLRSLHDMFPVYTGPIPMPMSRDAYAQEVKAENMYFYWLDGVRKALDMDLHQVARLAMLARFAPNEMARHRILHMLHEELQEVMFWHHMLIAYCGMGMPMPGPVPVPYPGVPVPAPGPNYGTSPGYTGPGFGVAPGVAPPPGYFGTGAHLPPSELSSFPGVHSESKDKK